MMEVLFALLVSMGAPSHLYGHASSDLYRRLNSKTPYSAELSERLQQVEHIYSNLYVWAGG